jgi:hypothetical protein
LVVNDKVGTRDVIVCNQVSFLEYIFLEKEYGPVFTQVASKNGRFGFRKLGLFEIPLAAIGLRFPPEVKEDDKNFFTDLGELRASLYVQGRPIAVFPEGSKTNGRGILQLEEGIVEVLANAAKSGMKVHTLRFDYEFEYASPYNTTDVLGLKHMIKVLTQVRNVMVVQYYFNLEEKLAGAPTDGGATTKGGKPVQNTPLDSAG